MSDVNIMSVMVDDVRPHPNADKLDIIKIGTYQVCETKGKYCSGDIVAHFPPDILIPVNIAAQLGVVNYLKDAVYPGDTYKTKCRVGAIRIRGIASFGFIIKVNVPVGLDLTDRFHGVKYEPVESSASGNSPPDNVCFHKYTDIQNYHNSKYRGAFSIGLPVRITEKIHGTNSRVGSIDGEFICGSHNRIKKDGLYWQPLTDNMKEMLQYIGGNVIAFGEIYGSKVQFMDYGVTGNSGYALFDISVNGTYLNWDSIVYYADKFGIPFVPLLYSGPFSNALIEQLVDGSTTVGKLNSKFKGREGIVITPFRETFSNVLGGRLILKAVSVDYLEQRKTDSH